jgi:hypothetical protein
VPPPSRFWNAASRFCWFRSAEGPRSRRASAACPGEAPNPEPEPCHDGAARECRERRQSLPPGAVVAGTLRAPSFAESGLKIDLPGGAAVVGTAAKILLVDFDVSQSFGQEAGASGAWVLHPVAKATELVLSGTVDVTLKLGAGASLPAGTTLADFHAVLAPAAGGDGVTLPFAVTAAGTYGAEFKYLFPGSYTLSLGGSLGVTFTAAPAAPLAVTVTSGQATAADFTLTAVSVP